MSTYGWELHHEPHRHYKRLDAERDKWTWEGRDRKRIASVTDVLDPKDSLVGWAVGRALIASERAAVQWLDAGPHLANSLLDFAELTQLTGLMPDTIRDDKGAIGTAVHAYLADRLEHPDRHSSEAYENLPYGYRTAVDRFLAESQFVPLYDALGRRVERAVGDAELAVAGTYDAQGRPEQIGSKLLQGVHRLDAKSSNTVQPKHYAQCAAYEELARRCGEEESDYLTIVHLDPLGGWEPHTIPAHGDEYHLALETFYSYLNIHRSMPKLAKLLKKED